MGPLVVVAAGDRRALVKANPLARVGDTRPVLASAGAVRLLTAEARSLSYEAVYRRQVWVNVCVNKLARAVARLPLKTFTLGADGERDRVRATDHPLPELLGRPFPRASAFGLKHFLVASAAVHGNALLVKARPSIASPPTELWPVPWRAVETRIGSSGQPETYVFNGTRGRIVIEARDVIHVALDPIGGIGVSPLEPLRATLQLEDAAVRWAANHFVNAATPSGVFTSESKLSDATIPRLRAELEGLYAGTENAGRFGLFDQGLRWQAMSHSAVDTALIEQRKLSREEVAAVYDIPQPMINILDRATFSNVTEQHKMLYQDTLGPWLGLLEETFAAQLIAEEPQFDGVFLEFDLAEVLKGDLPARADAYARLIASGVLTPNEARDRENLPRVDDPAADAIYVPLNLVPVGASLQDLEARARAAVALAPTSPTVPPTAPTGSSTEAA